MDVVVVVVGGLVGGLVGVVVVVVCILKGGEVLMEFIALSRQTW